MPEPHFFDRNLRAGRDEDGAGLIALIERCFADYPGCVLDVDGEMPELHAIATAFAALDGRFWVVADEGAIVGCVGAVPTADRAGLELRKMYVAHSHRRRGLGRALGELIDIEAKERGSRYVEIWSDTRFLEAHRLYASLGYEQTGETRELQDVSRSLEYYFRKTLASRPR